MIEPSLQTLARRLDELERENRRLKAGALLALLGLVAAGVMGQASLSGPPTVEAQRFYVRDGDGKARALLDADGSSGVFTAPLPRQPISRQAAPLDRALVA